MFISSDTQLWAASGIINEVVQYIKSMRVVSGLCEHTEHLSVSLLSLFVALLLSAQLVSSGGRKMARRREKSTNGRGCMKSIDDVITFFFYDYVNYMYFTRNEKWKIYFGLQSASVSNGPEYCVIRISKFQKFERSSKVCVIFWSISSVWIPNWWNASENYRNVL